jgi:hypothetical protein
MVGTINVGISNIGNANIKVSETPGGAAMTAGSASSTLATTTD